MKHSTRKQGVLTAVLSALLLLASSVIFFVFYFLTRYLPFILMGMTVLMPSVIYTWLLLIGFLRAPSNEECEEPAVSADEIAQEIPAKKRSFFEMLLAMGKGFVRLLHKAEGFLYVRRLWLILIPTALTMGVTHVLFWRMTARMTSVYKVGYLASVLLLGLFVLFVIFDKLCKHVSCSDGYVCAVLKDIRSAIGVARLSTLLALLIIVIRQLGFYELQKWLVVALGVIFAYETLFLLLSLLDKQWKNERNCC